jgi:hypothetical protein
MLLGGRKKFAKYYTVPDVLKDFQKKIANSSFVVGLELLIAVVMRISVFWV